MKSYIFDTSFLISLLDIDDINHEIALLQVSKLEVGSSLNRFFINESILSEIYTVWNYKMGFSKIDTLEAFLGGIEIQYITGNNEDYIAFFKLLKGKISVPDASVIYDALKHDLEMLCFDKQMNKIIQEIRK